jgi:hypothetical protein
MFITMCGHLSVVSFPLLVYVPSDTLKNAHLSRMFRLFDLSRSRSDRVTARKPDQDSNPLFAKRLPGDSVIRENQPYKVFQLGSRRTSYDSRNHDVRN